MEVTIQTLAAQECRRVTCKCSEPAYCGGWKTCFDRELELEDFCPACLIRKTAQEIADDVRGYHGMEIDGDPLRSHYYDADIVADYVEHEYTRVA